MSNVKILSTVLGLSALAGGAAFAQDNGPEAISYGADRSGYGQNVDPYENLRGYRGPQIAPTVGVQRYPNGEVVQTTQNANGSLTRSYFSNGNNPLHIVSSSDQTGRTSKFFYVNQTLQFAVASTLPGGSLDLLYQPDAQGNLVEVKYVDLAVSRKQVHDAYSELLKYPQAPWLHAKYEQVQAMNFACEAVYARSVGR